MTRTIRIGVESLLLAAVVAYTAVVVRDFSRYADHYPYLAIDDGLANVSYSLATEGRYGFLASPVQGFTDLMRDRGFFNYGPWYFYVGAGLIWLFGYSLTMLRAMHLAGILAIAATGCWWFGRRGQIATGALVALGLVHSFAVGQWPMVRPDIAVSVFAVLFIVAAGLAIEKGSPGFWFIAGLGAGCAALTHLIAWALVPCCFCTLAIALGGDWPAKRRASIALLAVVLGLTAATVMFYASFGFRIRDHLQMLRAYSGYLGGTTSATVGYGAALAEHLRMAFWYLSPRARAVLAGAVVVNLGLLAAAWRLRSEVRKEIIAVALPPVAVLLFYGLSLGSYGSHHTGYVILLQVAVWWCAGAVASSSLALLEGRLLPLRRAVATAMALILIGISASLVADRGSNPRLGLIQKWVSIQEYINKVAEFMPRGSSAWGTGMHGIESPGRLELVEFVDGVNIIERSRLKHPVDSSGVSPQYMLWDYPLNRDNTLKALRGRDVSPDPRRNVFRRAFDDVLGPVRYRIIGLVKAPPYGVTRVYQRLLNGADVARKLPAVSVYDDATQLWDERLEGPIAVSFHPVAPVLLNIDYTPEQAVPAHRSVVADLPRGRYLLRVRLETAPGSINGTIVFVTSVPSMTEAIGELGPSIDISPYTGHDDEAYLVYEHAGGPVYVSQFDNAPGAAIEGLDVYRIRPLLDKDQQAERSPFREMPPLAGWVPLASAGVQVAVAESGALVVDGDASRMGYQISSPPVPSRAFTRVTVRAAFSPAQGTVCVGALNGSAARWLANGGDPLRDFSFQVDETAAFRIVFYNCNRTDTGDAPSRFTLSEVRYAAEEPGLYVDRLLAVRAPATAAASIVPDPRVRSFPAGLQVTSDELAGIETLGPIADLPFHAPIARHSDDGWTIKGKADGQYSYVLRSKPQIVGDDRRLVAIGRVHAGGVTIGLLNNDQWAAQVNVTSPGEFTVVIAPPRGGTYDVVVANNLPGPSLDNDVVITQIGWVPR